MCIIIVIFNFIALVSFALLSVIIAIALCFLHSRRQCCDHNVSMSQGHRICHRIAGVAKFLSVVVYFCDFWFRYYHLFSSLKNFWCFVDIHSRCRYCDDLYVIFLRVNNKNYCICQFLTRLKIKLRLLLLICINVADPALSRIFLHIPDSRPGSRIPDPGSKIS